MSHADLQRFTFERQVLDEADLKAIVLDQLRDQGRAWSTACIASEYRLGTTSVRADLAVLGSEFVGIEIKSERDSLKRLANQVAAYTRYFDRVIVAVSDRHLPHLDWKALHKADVWKISETGRVTIASQRSELPETACPSDLLTSAQRERYGLNEAQPECDAVAVFQAEFRRRYSATSATFWQHVGRRKISRTDIELLSRFKEQRQIISEWEREQQDQWDAWGRLAGQLSVNRI